ncbi:MAG TPA: metallopeptidase family protein [Ktedonobacteraceae bacterium]
MKNNNEQQHYSEEHNQEPEQLQALENETQDPYQFQSLEDDDQEHEQLQDTQDTDEYDYNREPPLDSATIRSNRRSSKYVFMTLCFLVALLLLYKYITNANSGNTNDWFPLLGAIVLGILGVVYLRSSDNPPGKESPATNASATNIDGTNQKPVKTLTPFEELVQEALAEIPDEFHEKMENVTVHVEYEPNAETLARTGVHEGHTLLGLYEGVPLTSYGRHYAPYPEIITIYQRAIEDYCRHNPTRIREQVRSTVLHEVAHHFGMGHEEMPIWVK